jgi:hypothetical protein
MTRVPLSALWNFDCPHAFTPLSRCCNAACPTIGHQPSLRGSYRALLVGRAAR